MAITPHTPPHTATGAGSGRGGVLARRVRLLVAATITYNLIEAVIALVAGSRASSTVLIGFGLDSVIEVSSAAAVAWQFSAADPETLEARERVALRIIAGSFFALAAYIVVDSGRALLSDGHAQESRIGIVLAAVSLLVMPVLSGAQRRAGRELGSASAVADSKQTLLCTYLSAVLLAGLGLNALLGWSWADPLAALVIAVGAAKEGREAWRGDSCCTPALTAEPAAAVQSAEADVDPDAGMDRAVACADGCCPPSQPTRDNAQDGARDGAR